MHILMRAHGRFHRSLMEGRAFYFPPFLNAANRRAQTDKQDLNAPHFALGSQLLQVLGRRAQSAKAIVWAMGAGKWRLSGHYRVL